AACRVDDQDRLAFEARQGQRLAGGGQEFEIMGGHFGRPPRLFVGGHYSMGREDGEGDGIHVRYAGGATGDDGEGGAFVRQEFRPGGQRGAVSAVRAGGGA